MILTKTFLRLGKIVKKENLKLGEVLHAVSGNGHLLIILVLALPFLLPVPLPGLSVPFGILISITALLLLFRKPIWIPEAIGKKGLPDTFKKAGYRRIARHFRAVEQRIKPRLNYFTGQPMRIVSLVLILICGILLSLPLPPGTNFLPSLTIVLLTLGKLRSDGICILLGVTAFILNCLFFLYLFLLGQSLLEHFA